MAPQRRGQRPQDPPDDDDDDDEPAFTPKQEKAISDMIGGAVGGLKRKLPKLVSEAVATPIGELRSLIESNMADPDEPDDEPAPRQRGRGQRREQDPEPAPRRGRSGDPQLAAVTKRLDAFEADQKAAREQASARDRDDKLRALAKDAGVDTNRMRGAVAVLREMAKKDDTTGEWYLVLKNNDGTDNELDLDAGVPAWAGTDEGKAYLAPPAPANAGRGGTGTRQAMVQTPAAGTLPARPARRAVIGSPAPAGGSAGAAAGQQDPAKAQRLAEAHAKLADGLAGLGGGSVPLA